MNVFFAKILMYHQIQQLNAEGYSLSKIGSLTSLDRRTVKRYLAMTEQEFEVFQDNLSDRKKQLLPYEHFVKERLEAYRDTSAAQMHDWLKEHYPDFPSVPKPFSILFTGFAIGIISQSNNKSVNMKLFLKVLMANRLR